MEQIIEPSRTLTVSERYDVAVVGGGIAGVAAALAAARQGARVGLIEKEYGLGGLATLGNVIVYLPLCDGRGEQVIGGLGEELLLRSVRDLRTANKACGMMPVPDCWRPGGDPAARESRRYDARFNPAAFQLELEVMIEEAGVDLWYDTRLCQVVRDGGRVTHLIVENKDGRSAMACGVVIDATGDADVCHLAGERTESLDWNVLTSWHYQLKDGELTLHAWSNRFSDRGKEFCEGPFFRGDRARDVTQHVLGCRAVIREHIAALRAKYPDSDIQPFALASIPGLRMTRRLVASYSLAGADDHVWHEDAIGLTGDWRKPGPVYSLPFRTLRGEANANLLAVGRCMSSDVTAWDITRVIPPCAVTGEAAGVAAAMVVAETGADLHSLSIPRLQDRLRAQGVILDRAKVEGRVVG